jgi:1-acyl-sn-glycerol-3-phosphate acyltransferase
MVNGLKNILNNLLVKFYHVGAKLLIHMVYNCKFSGFDNIPATGPCVVIANHVSFVDGLILNAASKRDIRFIIAEEIYNQPIVHYFMTLDRAIPIKASKEAVKKALETASEALRNGEVVAIFPEGQITYSGYMGRFKFGVEWILKNDQVPVVPVALVGLWGSIFSRKYLGRKFRFVPKYFRKEVKAICGAPIPPEQASINNLQKILMNLYEDNL